ncbi:hypothetical protein Q0Z83_086580 [Actinoplanes sichuanensis]|nr:hypothetical protein Q0Z83_086580 [Actinoplanes sichuanensis]
MRHNYPSVRDNRHGHARRREGPNRWQAAKRNARRPDSWGLSVLLRPDPASLEDLADTAHDAARIAGGSHWITGAKDSAHLTMRTLEPWHTSSESRTR